MTLQEFMKNRPHNERVPIEQAVKEYIKRVEETSVDRLNKLNKEVRTANFDDNLFIVKEDFQSTTNYEESQTNLKLDLELVTSDKDLSQINSFYQDVVSYIESYDLLNKDLSTRTFEFKDRG